MLILASTSATRIRLLQNAGVKLRAMPPKVDESALQVKFKDQSPAEMAKTLAAAKALSLSATHPDNIIIGADQTLELSSRQFHKPVNLVEAKQQLLALRGKTHCLTSAIACAQNGEIIWETSGQALLTMRDFTSTFLDNYLANSRSQILSSVGGYQLENAGAQLFDKIDGDYFTILGFPLLKFLDFLRTKDLLPS